MYFQTYRYRNAFFIVLYYLITRMRHIVCLVIRKNNLHTYCLLLVEQVSRLMALWMLTHGSFLRLFWMLTPGSLWMALLMLTPGISLDGTVDRDFFGWHYGRRLRGVFRWHLVCKLSSLFVWHFGCWLSFTLVFRSWNFRCSFMLKFFSLDIFPLDMIPSSPPETVIQNCVRHDLLQGLQQIQMLEIYVFGSNTT